MSKHLFSIALSLILLGAVFLRLYRLDSLPASLYWEEAALGYDAYSMWQTGRDHHGNAWPIVAFESFGDYKPSLYFYAIVPFVATLGLNEWAVRLPSAVAGMATVVAVGLIAQLLAKKWFSNSKAQYLLLIAMAVAGISPWALVFSRGGWEVNLATALISWGMYCGLRYESQLREVKGTDLKWLVGSVIALVLSMYAYHATRLLAPLLGMCLVMMWSATVLSNKTSRSLAMIAKQWLIAGLLSVLLLMPILSSLGNQSTSQRFAETSILNDVTFVEESNLRQERAGHTLASKLLYHRYWFYGKAIALNYFSHLSIDFMFVAGDANPRHSVQFFGQLYHIEFIFLLAGIYVAIRKGDRYSWLLFGWLVLSILPAAITKASPHALRILPGLPVWLVLISVGIVELHTYVVNGLQGLLKSWRIKKITLALGLGAAIAVLYLIELTVFWRFYSKVYAVIYASEWQYGYEQMVQAVSRSQLANDQLPVYITREQGRPAMYYWFYTQANPAKVQAADAAAKQDQGEYIEFENIKFPNTVNEVGNSPAIVASSQEGFTQLSSRHRVEVIEEVNDLRGKTVWVVYKIL
ncbi:MAG TPA: hypothetical protein VD999_04725 [Vitreimonas sp.]|nr:hypothetical protein [Vitreimonas sp.]